MFNILSEWFNDATPFQEEIARHDINNDGILSSVEMNSISQKDMDVLRDNAHTDKEWEALREITLERGEYKDTTGVLKGFEKGEGGRFRFLTDQISSTSNISHKEAEAVAANIGRKWGKI